MIRRPPRSTLDRSSAASDVYKRQVFANIILADEINRTPPKTQAALLEAMQEKNVTIGGTLHKLELPFFVLATQNPIEQEGTYPCLLYTSDAADERSSVDLGGRRIIKKKTIEHGSGRPEQ